MPCGDFFVSSVIAYFGHHKCASTSIREVVGLAGRQLLHTEYMSLLLQLGFELNHAWSETLPAERAS